MNSLKSIDSKRRTAGIVREVMREVAVCGWRCSEVSGVVEACLKSFVGDTKFLASGNRLSQIESRLLPRRIRSSRR